MFEGRSVLSVWDPSLVPHLGLVGRARGGDSNGWGYTAQVGSTMLSSSVASWVILSRLWIIILISS